jgi:hypothetical protein
MKKVLPKKDRSTGEASKLAISKEFKVGAVWPSLSL